MSNREMSYAEERALGSAALDTYMEMMTSAYRETCGRGVISLQHGTHWCSEKAKRWAASNGLNHKNHNETGKWPGWSQFMFIRDEVLCYLLGVQHHTHYPTDADYDDQVGASVPDVVIVGEHTSKSITLPVMQFKWRDMLVTTRYNFHDWKVSVQMPLGLDPTEDLLDIARSEDHLLHPVYFEGFPKPYIYQPLAAGDYALTGQFSTLFGNQYRIWTFFWLLKRWYEGRFGPLTT